jgi:hypothetical protein
MREVLYDMISALRARNKQKAPKLILTSHGIVKSCFQDDLLFFSGLTDKFQALREELKVNNVEKQLYKLRRRVAFTQFYNNYINTQADLHTFLYSELKVKSLKATQKWKRTLSFNTAKRCRVKLSILIHNRVVNLIFSSFILSYENINTEENRAERAEKVAKREAAN